MSALDPRVRMILAAMAALAVLLALWHGRRQLRLARPTSDAPSSLALVRGIRALILGAGCAAILAGLLTHTSWPILFGLVFIGEELLETGVMLLALRSERRERDAEGDSSGDTRGGTGL